MSRPKAPRTQLEDYLTTIYRLEEALGFAKITDISRELRVSPATVSKTIKRLEGKNLVEREKYRFVKLTSAGRRIAEHIVRKHRIAEVFLFSVLGFNDLESHIYAHYLEHLPDIVIERLFVVMGKPAVCPHGNDIPGAVKPSNVGELVNLNSAKTGQVCVIMRVAGEFLETLEYLHSAGLSVHTSVKIVDRNVDKVVVEVYGNHRVDVPSYIARFVHVKCWQ